MKTAHPDTYKFLRELRENNNKEWMDANRKWYTEIRNGLIDLASTIQASFAEEYPMAMMDPKKYLARINNNRRFHPDKPPYKNNFALMIKRRGPGWGDFYLHIEPDNLFVGTGIYHPPRELLLALRDLIDVRGDELRQIGQASDLKEIYGDLGGDKLKKQPKGFEADHPHIDLLRHKDMILSTQMDEDIIFSTQGVKELQKAFKAAIPFMDFIDLAIESA